MVPRQVLALAVAAVLSACSIASNAQESESRNAMAYVVEVAEEESPRRVADDIAAATGGTVLYVYTTVFHGFAISVPAGTTAQDLLADPRIVKVERDAPVSVPRPVEDR